MQEALASFDRALALQPASPESLNNRGSVLALLKRYDEGLASLNRALALKPDYAEAFSNRANALEKLNRFEEALASCDRALAIKPGYPEAFNNGGNALRELQRPEEALARYDRALALKPDYPEALSNRGSALMDLKRFGAAAKCFEQLMEIAPAWDYAAGNLLSCHLYSCDWEKVAALTTRVSDAVERGEKVIAPFAFLAVSDSLAAQLQCSLTYSADRYPTSTIPVWTGQRYRHDRIRLAYLSADFREHATAYLMAGLFEAHDKRRFETTALSFGRDDRSGTRERLRRSFERFVDVSGKSDREIAQLIRHSEIDIAVDLKGFTTDCRAGILAHRPAPIQVSYLGYPGTLGADHIDYILADRRVIPPEDTVYYSEKIVYLPDTYQVNDSKRKIAEKAPTRAEATLPERAFVFCCFNNNYKIRPDVFDIWMRLLNKVEGSVLWLLEDNAAVSHNLHTRRSGEELNQTAWYLRHE